MQKGDFVVLVDDKWKNQGDAIRRGVRYPIRGPVYTVRSVLPSPISADVALLLEEIVNPEVWYKHNGVSLGKFERRFGARRFRKLNPKALDVFRQEVVDA